MPYNASQIRSLNTSVTVDTTFSQILGEISTGQRQSLVIVNTSTSGQKVTLAWGQEASTDNGIVLYPAGTHAESIDSAFIPLNTYITAVASAAGATLAIQQRVIPTEV